jgi:hypothetical protein
MVVASPSGDEVATTEVELPITDPNSDITELVWHSLGSAEGDRVGPNQSLIDALEGAKVKWEIWLSKANSETSRP